MIKALDLLITSQGRSGISGAFRAQSTQIIMMDSVAFYSPLHRLPDSSICVKEFSVVFRRKFFYGQKLIRPCFVIRAV